MAESLMLIDWNHIVERARNLRWNFTGERQECVLFVIYPYDNSDDVMYQMEPPAWLGYIAPANKPLHDHFEGAVESLSGRQIRESELLWGRLAALVNMGMYSPAAAASDGSGNYYVVKFDDLTEQGREVVRVMQQTFPDATFYLATYLDT